MDYIEKNVKVKRKLGENRFINNYEDKKSNKKYLIKIHLLSNTSFIDK